MSTRMIKIVDYSVEPEEVFARLWWSPAQGLTCDNAHYAANLAAEGLAVPPNGQVVFPHDGNGREFFEKFIHRASTYLRAHTPVAVKRQHGALFPRPS